MTPPADRHPDNVRGDFYVECNSCLCCEAPYHEAPDLMGQPGTSPKNYGCFFRKQPVTPDEIDRACSAVMVSCIKAVRYAGDDPVILRSLYERGAYASCDIQPTDVERELTQYVTDHYQSAKKRGVHWTYVREESPERLIIACCFGPHPHTLGLFLLKPATRQIELVKDDAMYRPQFDHFQKPGWRAWWWPFANFPWM